MKLLVDTSALLALMMPRDRHHARAARFVRDSPHARFVLTELILAETVTRARARGSAEQAVATADRLLRSRRYELVLLDEDLLREAHRRPKQRAKTRLNRVGKTQRLKQKKARGAVKANRGKPSRSDW